MSEVQPYIAPLIALAGTLVVALLGLYQWRRQHSNPNRSAVAESRRKAAESIWAHVEEVNLKLRPFGEDARTIDIKIELRALNEIFLRNSLYLDDSLQGELNAYVLQLHAVAQRIDEYQDGKDEWETSVIVPAHRVGQYQAINTELEALNDRRARIKGLLLAAAAG